MDAFVNEINAFAYSWVIEFWRVLYQSALLVCVIYTVTRYRKISANLRFWLWMLVPLRMLIMPIVTVSLPILPVTEPAISEQQTLGTNAVGSLSDTLNISPDTELLSASETDRNMTGLEGERNGGMVLSVQPSFYTYLLGLWVLGAMIFLLRIIRGWLRINSIIINGSFVEDQNILRIAQQAVKAIGLARCPMILTTDKNISPFVSGIIRPVVVLPQAVIEKLPDEHLQAIFTHEFAHLRRYDPLTGWIVTICQVFYFFHPVYHVARYYLLLDREMACDERVISVGRQSKSVYAQALVSAGDVCHKLRYQFAPITVAAESFTHLQRRLLHMSDRFNTTGRISKRALFIFLLLGLISIPGINLKHRQEILAMGKAEPLVTLNVGVVDTKGNRIADSGVEILSNFRSVSQEWTDSDMGNNPATKVETLSKKVANSVNSDVNIPETNTTPRYVTIDFDNVDITVFIKFISELTGKNFLIDEKVRGKVTIICPTMISIKAAYRVFELVLEVHGFTTVPSGKVIKIVPAVDARAKNIATKLREEAVFPEDRVETRLIPLRYADPEELKKHFAPLISKNSVMIAYAPTRMLIVTDVKSNIVRLLKIIDEIDVEGMGEQISVLPLEYATATDIAKDLNDVFQRSPRGPQQNGPIGPIKIVPYDRTNDLIVRATETETLQIKAFIELLDKETVRGEGDIHVRYLQNANAEDLAQTLPSILSGDTQTTKKGEAPIISKDVQIVVDKSTNSLIIKANKEDYLILKDVIQKLDEVVIHSTDP